MATFLEEILNRSRKENDKEFLDQALAGVNKDAITNADTLAPWAKAALEHAGFSSNSPFVRYWTDRVGGWGQQGSQFFQLLYNLYHPHDMPANANETVENGVSPSVAAWGRAFMESLLNPGSPLGSQLGYRPAMTEQEAAQLIQAALTPYGPTQASETFTQALKGTAAQQFDFIAGVIQAAGLAVFSNRQMNYIIGTLRDLYDEYITSSQQGETFIEFLARRGAQVLHYWLPDLDLNQIYQTYQDWKAKQQGQKSNQNQPQNQPQPQPQPAPTQTPTPASSTAGGGPGGNRVGYVP